MVPYNDLADFPQIIFVGNAQWCKEVMLDNSQSACRVRQEKIVKSQSGGTGRPSCARRFGGQARNDVLE